MKLWGGRFNKELDKIANDFNSSIAVDGRMYYEDITGSIAHACADKTQIPQAIHTARVAAVRALGLRTQDAEAGREDTSPP